MKVEIWSDIACPWCYIGKVRFEKALAEYEHKDAVSVSWHAFQLQPDAPSTNPPSSVEHLMKKYGRSHEQVLGMTRQVTEVAAGEGLEYALDRAVAANTRDAHRLNKLAEDRGLGKAMQERLMRAYQCEGANVADAGTLVRLGVEVGLGEDEVRELLASDAYEDAVDADLMRASQFGVSGVPFFVIDEQHGISGAQATETFLSALKQLGPKKPKLVMVGTESGAVCDDDGCVVPQERA